MTISVDQHLAVEGLANGSFARAHPTRLAPLLLVDGETQTLRLESNLVAWAISGEFDENEPVSDTCLKKTSGGLSDVPRYSRTRSGLHSI
jgi:hypothetical protein